MSKIDLSIVILAAGKGTRLKGPWGKPLCPILGRVLLDYLLDAVDRFTQVEKLNAQVSLVVGHRKDELIQFLESRKQTYPGLQLKAVEQSVQNGTAGAVQSFFSQTPLESRGQKTLIVCGDTPCITAETLGRIVRVQSERNLKAVAASFKTTEPKSYGRIVRSENSDTGLQIVEAAVADESVLAINEVNSGIYVSETTYLDEMLGFVTENAMKKELFLTDIFQMNAPVDAVCFQDAEEFLGVNDLHDLATVRAILQKRKIASLIESGVDCLCPERIYCDWDVQVSEGVQLHADVSLFGKTSIAQRAQIHQGCVITNSNIGQEVRILPYSVIESAHIGPESQIGPFARLRPGTELDADVKIGNFVEVKKSHFRKGSKASHLSYIGDAEIGEESNLGCGFITCNYDGANKHKTVIGKECFIGSDCQAVAPVTIADQSFVAAGSTITQDVPKNSFAIARAKQVTKEGIASRFRKTKMS